MFNMRKKLTHLPTRVAAGSYILNSGLAKLDSDDDYKKQIHSMASGVYPAVRHTDARTFATVLGLSEVTLGGALLLPLVPAQVAGLALGAFASGLLGLYVKTPSMTRGSGLRPTENGTALAKDVWLMGIALSLIVDGGRGKAGRSRKAG
jgi:uncharacterized membrane protein YphA (DoxX/SURF4 family)